MIFDRLARVTAPGSTSAGRLSSRIFGLPAAGIPVDEQSALKFGAVWGCVKVISETLMVLPWRTYSAQGADRIPAPDNPVNEILSRQPNPEMPAYSFVSTLAAHALLRGNCYAEIERTRGGDPLGLWLLDPERVTLERDLSGFLYYKVRNDRGVDTEIPPEDMYHVRGPSHDGLTGYSVVGMARESVSAGLAAERFGATFFGNGAIPGGIIQHQAETKLKGFDDKSLKNFYESWEARLGGSKGSNKVMYIDPGLDYKQMSIPPNDAQFIETRKLSVPEICRWFRVPPHKVMDLEKATFSNIEHQGKEFVDDCIVPWAVRFEQEANLKLLGDPFYSKMHLQALLRGDSVARADYYQRLMDRGVYNINEVRALEEQNGIGPDGEKRMVPLNMTTLDKLGEDETRGAGPAK